MMQRPILQSARIGNFLKVLLAVVALSSADLGWSVTTTFDEHRRQTSQGVNSAAAADSTRSNPFAHIKYPPVPRDAQFCEGDAKDWHNCFGVAGQDSELNTQGEWQLVYRDILLIPEFEGGQYAGWFRYGKPHGTGVEISSEKRVLIYGAWVNGRCCEGTSDLGGTGVETTQILALAEKYLSQEKQKRNSLDGVMEKKQCTGDLAGWSNCWGVAAAAMEDRNTTITVRVFRAEKPTSGAFYFGHFINGQPTGEGMYEGTIVRYQGVWKQGLLSEKWDYDDSRGKKLVRARNEVLLNENKRHGQSELSVAIAAETAPSAVDDKAEVERLKAQLAALQAQTSSPTKQGSAAIRAERRVALVIGNARYVSQPLRNPTNDARDVAARLSKLNFKVFLETDLSLNRMRQVVRKFADEYARSDVGLVYYSGHGIETRGSNYLIPVNADIRREYELTEQAYPASQLTQMFETVQNIGDKERMAILILDACRNNDLPRAWRSVGKGLARMDAPKGTFISFATAPGSVAADGMGRNSPFTKHLLLTLDRPNLSIEKVFKEVRIGVVNETNNEQVPWESSSLMGDFYFNRTK